MIDPDSTIAGSKEAFHLAETLADEAAGRLVHQGLVDVVSTRRLRHDDFPLHLDMLAYARCLAAIFADRARIVALASGAPAPIALAEVRAKVEAAQAAGAIKRGAEALAQLDALPEGPVRALLLFGLGASADLFAAEAPIAPPVDFSVHARLLEGSFEDTFRVRFLAEGKAPSPFI